MGSSENPQAEDLISRAKTLEQAASHYRAFMETLGLPLTEETESTPLRVARMFLDDFTSFNGQAPQVAKFKRANYDQYIVVRDIQFSSLCEHHHMPFWGLVHIGYHPQDWLAGLSKFSRVVKYFSSRPQLQEHLTAQIAEYLDAQLHPRALIVVASAEHSCVKCRGARDPRSQTITSKIIKQPGVVLSKDEMFRLMGV